MVAFRTRRFWLERLAAAWRGKSGLRIEFVNPEALTQRLRKKR